jgi:hypothetical protein
VEYYRDIRPILREHCVQCHSGSTAAAGLNLNDEALVRGFDGTYRRLANDPDATWSPKSMINTGGYRFPNASRYVRMFQSRRSLLMWKLMGRRLDGWTNQDHPTESKPGDKSTLPAGANPNHADLDYTGSVMPPLGSGVAPLSDQQKLTIARWIDLGCPISNPEAGLGEQHGWLVDEIKPTIAISTETQGSAITALRIGLNDANSGLDLSTLSIKASSPLQSQTAQTELASHFARTGEQVWSLRLDRPLPPGTVLQVRVKDLQGNETVVNRKF